MGKDGYGNPHMFADLEIAWFYPDHSASCMDEFQRMAKATIEACKDFLVRQRGDDLPSLTDKAHA